MHWWNVTMVHTWTLIISPFAIVLCLTKHSLPPYLILLTGRDSKRTTICCFPSAFPRVSLSVPLLEKWRKGTIWWKSSQILALNTSVSRLCFSRIERADRHFEGEAAEVISSLCWHHIRSILLLYWVDIGLQSLRDSSCKWYLGVISTPSSVS